MTTNGNGKEKMIDKIRKLLALSQSPNEHEAALAAGKAQALLAEYNLSMSDVAEKDADEDDSVIVDAAGTTSSYPWRRPLADVVAKMYFCRYFYTTRRFPTKVDIHNFVGARHNVAVAKMMFSYLNETIDRLAKEGALKVQPKERSPYRTTFRAMCAYRVGVRIREHIEAAKKGQIKSEGGSNLPALLDLYKTCDQRNEAFIADKFGKIKEKKSRQSILHDQAARDGHVAGDNIGLDPQVSAGTKHLLR